MKSTMKKKLIMLTLSWNSVGFALLQPGTPAVVTAVNSAEFKLSGFCNPGGVNVSIDFGGLSFSAPCNGVTATYNFIGDVSSETSTNPIQQCVSQSPVTTICSRPVDNELAPPSGSFDATPLVAINAENQTAYSVSGLCAPIGASVSLDVGASSGVLSGTCSAGNRFDLVGDVSAVADGVGLTATVIITSGGSSSVSTTVDKDTSAASPFPVVTAVSSSFVDADLDTWLEAGDGVTIAVQFSEAVNLTDAVELDVAISSGIKSLSYLSGSGTNTLNFNMPVLTSDEQCNGLVTIRGIDLNGGSIVGVTTSELASFSELESDLQTEKIDAALPIFTGSLTLDTTFASVTSSPAFFNQNLRGEDNCVATELRASIGETVGGTEATPFVSLPSSVTNSYQIVDGVDGYTFTLFGGTTYFVNLRAYDAAGNFASLSSASWVLSPIYTIPNLIVYLEGMEPASVLDSAGRNSSDGLFNGFVQSFLDSSASPVVHNFTAMSSTQRPAFNGVTDSLEFDQSNDCLETLNHPEINTSTVSQRSFSGVFTMGPDVTTRQIFFEEGGSSRGMNLYVQGGTLYCGFWNIPNDGDGSQSFVSRTTAVTAGQTYNITSVFDYTNYAGPVGPNGTFNCYVNGVSMGAAVPITSRLFAHSGDVSLGCSGDSTFTHAGSSGSPHYSGGQVKEFMMFNSPPDASDALVKNLRTSAARLW